MIFYREGDEEGETYEAVDVEEPPDAIEEGTDHSIVSLYSIGFNPLPDVTILGSSNSTVNKVMMSEIWTILGSSNSTATKDMMSKI